ncbi:3',5'-cyclic AMP phosphodiesterase CpdA [Roseibium hamelinense]|uniref:3',5'-cyclic AMP phosphodiesterase CpdA n=1 Tax=Roseibium hamelinense TaxID=150831 RepID=A0A562SXN3_9HYPH|nr:metallophosphoesterase [Roseibium hamelinense]MTI43583.1 metallophosphoesterase [Roseibium hamelinense]TWI86097.1 3',5'-cyclic AMP phosphodiesterase CpdA [Roseibium hamelinense]
MLKLAHLSDPHLGPLPDPKLIQLFSKRVIGYLNWRRNRAKAMSGSYLDRLVSDLKSQNPDHIAITGDLVNIALPLEISGARQWLEEVGIPEHVSVVPGNHDAYVPGAIKKAIRSWLPYMRGDEESPEGASDEATFPYVRIREHVAIVGVSTARASAPWFATGRLGSAQSRRLATTLEELGQRGLLRVVLIHHPPFRKATRWHKRLSDASRLRAAVKRAGAELILHGHTHIDSRATIEGPDGPVPVIGVPSATSAPGGKNPAARYNVFELTKHGDSFSCVMSEHGFEPNGENVVKLSERRLEIPRSIPA